MGTRKFLILAGIVSLASLLALALLVVLPRLQGTQPVAHAALQVPAEAEAELGDVIPVQGRLTDASGRPLTGTYDIYLYIYNVKTGGTALCGNWFPSTQVTNGLFNAAMDLCAAVGAIQGDQLYLGVRVGSDPEMTPRLAIYAVPYAFTVKPGAVIKGDDSYVFVPGTLFIKDQSSDPTRWDLADATALIFNGDTLPATRHIRIPITLPGVLYGQPVRITSITVYYKCQNGAQGYITDTQLYKQLDADTSVSLVDDVVNRTSTVATSYSLPTDSANNILSSNQGFITLRLGLTFSDNASYVQISGVRVTLDHTY